MVKRLVEEIVGELAQRKIVPGEEIFLPEDIKSLFRRYAAALTQQKLSESGDGLTGAKVIVAHSVLDQENSPIPEELLR